MKRLLQILLFITAALSMAGTAGAQAAGTLKMPAYKKTRLKNGMTLLLMERHSVPLIGFQVIVRAGSAGDPEHKEGAAFMAASLLRKGTKTRNAEQFAAELDFIGGTFSSFANADSSEIAAEFVAKDAAKGLDLLSEALLHPAFPQDEFNKLLKQRIDGLKAAKDQAQGVIGAYYNAYLFGRHPYARPTTGDENSLAAITRDDAQKFYQAYYTPANTILAVAGDFSTADMEKMVAQKFEGWAARPAPAISVPEPAPVTGKRLLLIDKPDSTQTYFRIGNIGITRTNPDRLYIEVVNTLFGGRFTSMINSELRIKSGLTYGASSFFDRRKVRGPFAIATFTKNATTIQAIDKTLEVLRSLHEKSVTAEDLQSAKNYILGQFPPTVETSQQLAGLMAELEFYGLDDREINDMTAKINAMTLADAKRIIQQYYPQENLVFVLIGKASEIGDAVKKYASKMEVRSINDPGFGSYAASEGPYH
ncbi:MAG TPA: pitrilysin family protein [Candidatus Saccharimonadales bacterium]|jgi:zinc protease|nr:pitrilysin family protein [Candidatus Saccharimonadales bacterium]